MVRFKNRYVIAKIRLHDKQPTHAEAIHSALLEELSLSFGELGRAQCTKSNALQVKFFEPKKALLFVMRCNQRDLKMVKKSIERVKRVSGHRTCECSVLGVHGKLQSLRANLLAHIERIGDLGNGSGDVVGEGDAGQRGKRLRKRCEAAVEAITM
jgi:RNase P/RNase MRP subunit POP5